MDIESAFQTARLLLEADAERIEMPAPDSMDFYLKKSEDLLTLTAGLRVKRLGYLAAITGLDPGIDSQELEIIYHFCTDGAYINLRVRIPKQEGSVQSLSQMIPGAEPFERELSEMLGVNVTGLPNPDHLYLPDDWPDETYPLRKDFLVTAEQTLSQEG